MRTFAFTLLVALTAVAVGCKKKPDTSPTGGSGTGTDSERLQGVWAVESIESGDPKKAPSEDELKKTRFAVKGDRLTILGDGRVEDTYSVVLDPAKDPKTMTLTQLDETGKPRVRMGTAPSSSEPMKKTWLYKFDGDMLVLAIAESKDEPPTEFKVRALDPANPKSSAVFLAKLKKTDESIPSNPPRRSSPTTRVSRGTSR